MSQAWTDEKVEGIIGQILRSGVLLAASVVLIGGMLYLVERGMDRPDHRVFHGEPVDLRHPEGIVKDALALQSRGLIQLGLLLLIATPVTRVIFTVFAFFRQRDYLYVVVTLMVLAVLLYGLFGSHP